MSKSISSRFSRSRPALNLSFDWRHRGRTDVHGRRELEVTSHYSSNEEPVAAPSRADGHQLPNEVVVAMVSGEARTTNQLRLSREGAAALRDMLDAALAWDGVAP